MKKIIYIDNFLVEHGHTPTIGNSLVQLFRREGYHVITASSRKNKFLRLADMVQTIYKHRKHAVVLIATYSTSAFLFAQVCGAVCRWLQVPYVPCLHGGNLPERIIKSPSVSKKLFENSFTNVAVSGYLAESMKQNGWKHKLIPNTIFIQDYSYMHRTAAKPKLLWVRSFHQIYNPQLAIRVLHRILQHYPTAQLTMVGPAKDESINHCRELVKQLQLEAHVTFTGKLAVEEWTSLAASHDIFLNTTNFDNLPVSVIEAMALGMIVVSTNVGGLPYLISHQHDGLLVEKEDDAGFIKSVLSVLENQSQSGSLSSSARETALQYDWEKVKLEWHDLFAELGIKLPTKEKLVASTI